MQATIPPRSRARRRLVSLSQYTLLAGALFALSPLANADATNVELQPYHIVKGRVDESTYRGWQIYHSACHTCHGVDATGTQVAPSLIERMKTLSAKDFTVKVLTSYRIVIDSQAARADDSTGIRDAIVAEVLRRERGELVMPAWEGDAKVHPHLLDLYAYLKARSDGALGPGRPQKLAP